MSISKAPPIHPGEILRELYLAPLSMTPYSLARQLRVPRTRIERIVGEKVGISADTALRLAKFFQTTPEFWLNLQAAYDLKRESSALEAELAQIPAFEAA
ncbi:plasmid maintenance system antidote protein, XRE family [Rhizobium sp. PDO1-076]|uniref:HigA family addiction module antitoxin n=1 Tax=Rhizobium sp. PDO1-076 TaxID=1125979 RepID=UPI00024E3CA1|nr:HigA family addiction module antitoxin [Rhizobium sp. PDO1-076]EHS52028.1 plasmid maintenance system antidote protein, XRE family [Rhizobium sp. PDO1-076]